mmetsp:Transcript_6952/g.15245  ORF Transcript_6952/g.15245 Transcript_6952/m.15245 type:complete len:278 (-) Transcript_6952:272-1105(-)
MATSAASACMLRACVKSLPSQMTRTGSPSIARALNRACGTSADRSGSSAERRAGTLSAWLLLDEVILPCRPASPSPSTPSVAAASGPASVLPGRVHASPSSSWNSSLIPIEKGDTRDTTPRSSTPAFCVPPTPSSPSSDSSLSRESLVLADDLRFTPLSPPPPPPPCCPAVRISTERHASSLVVDISTIHSRVPCAPSLANMCARSHLCRLLRSRRCLPGWLQRCSALRFRAKRAVGLRGAVSTAAAVRLLAGGEASRVGPGRRMAIETGTMVSRST